MFKELLRSQRRFGAHEAIFVRWMHGDSGALLARDDKGQQWVVEPIEPGQESRVVPNELLGATLLRSVGLPSLPWRRLKILSHDQDGTHLSQDSWFLRGNRDQIHFASLHPGEPKYITLPLETQFEEGYLTDAWLGLYVFDLWAGHVYRRKVLLATQPGTGKTNVFAVENRFLFYGPQGRSFPNETIRPDPTPAMRSVVTRQASLPILLNWAVKMQALLPTALEGQLQPSYLWGSNELTSNPQHFRDRLNRLPSMVRAEWERQREQS